MSQNPRELHGGASAWNVGGSWIGAGASQLQLPGGRGLGCWEGDGSPSHGAEGRGGSRSGICHGSLLVPRWVPRSCAPCSAKSSRSFTPSPPSTSWTAPFSTAPRRRRGTCPCTAVRAPCCPPAAPHTQHLSGARRSHSQEWLRLEQPQRPPSPPSPRHCQGHH